MSLFDANNYSCLWCIAKKVCVFMCVCMYVCMYVCVCVCVYIYIQWWIQIIHLGGAPISWLNTTNGLQNNIVGFVIYIAKVRAVLDCSVPLPLDPQQCVCVCVCVCACACVLN